MVKKIKKIKKHLGLKDKDFSKDNFLEGAIIRPLIQITSFAAFIFAMFLLLIDNYKWGGSLIMFSFVLNLSSIYKSLMDKPSIYRTMNLAFKLILIIAEIVAFNYIAMSLKLK